nr:cytochrome P450 CYP82D47-like [Ipomoea batatas]
MDFLSHLLALGLFVIIYLLLWGRKTRKSYNLPPEPAGALPFIGHLHKLDGQGVPLARLWGSLADKYGPIFTVRLGVHRTLVVSSWEAVKDCFTTHDKDFADRSVLSAATYLGYNYAMLSFTTYGPYWRKLRKLLATQVLSAKRLEELKHVRVAELQLNIKELYGSKIPANQKINIGQWFEKLTLNVVLKIVAGKRYSNLVINDDGSDFEEAQRIINAIKDHMYLDAQLVLYDAIPFPLFKWIDFQGYIKAMKRNFKETDSILQVWIDEHVERRRRLNGGADDRDFIDVMFSVIDDEFTSDHGHSQETVIKATAMSMILDASDTTAAHLTWTLSLLLNNGDAMKRAQEEIDAQVGKGGWVEDSDVDNLPYLQAIVKETLRLYPPAPVLVPHEAMQDCNVGGYHIPRGTRLYVNAWKLHRDPRVWCDPEKFVPERFLTTHAKVDASGRHFEFVPFSSGRRSCPGIAYTLQVTHLTLARLLQGFNFSIESGSEVDMTETPGTTMHKAAPLEVFVAPRLPSLLYQL